MSAAAGSDGSGDKKSSRMSISFEITGSTVSRQKRRKISVRHAIFHTLSWI